MTEDEKRKWYKRAALFGLALGLLCHVLPPHYRVPCEFLSNLCTGG